ncbi:MULTISPECIES: methionyl-tRNA formyltransferase [Comamonas]|uniref:methionyl-tRNA formyltransferase n=1 Tax=Comamonas TaxID=283 RepID=UPI00257E6DB2|nr:MULTISPECIES: formyltransferase family protein [Comamonas]
MREIKILLITQGVSRLVKPLFNSEYQVVGVLESMPREFNNFKKNSLLADILKKIYSRVMNKDLSLSDFCKKKNIAYNFICKKNAKEVAAWIESLKPDLIVVSSMSQLLKEDVLKIPPLGVINLHPSFLPNYRGANPDFWQYYDMEMNPGVTVHYVDVGEDTGDIIFQERVHIPLGTKSPARLDKLIGELGVSLMLKAIDATAHGNAPRTPQPAQSPTARSRNLKPEEHTQIIDWKNWPIERVWHVLRGTELWLNAIKQPVGMLAGQRWSIQEYEKTEMPQGTPGEVGRYKKRKCVFTKDGVIYIDINFDIKKVILKILQK